MRWLSTFLSILVILAFAVDAVAQPCAVVAMEDLTAEAAHAEEMPCHRHATSESATPVDHDEKTPHQDTCCCPVLVTPVIGFSGTHFKQPLPQLLAWSSPLNDRADSVPFEHDPPPPRA